MGEGVKTLKGYIDSDCDIPLCFRSREAVVDRGRLTLYTLMEKPKEGDPYLNIRPLTEPNPLDESCEPVQVLVRQHLEDEVVDKI